MSKDAFDANCKGCRPVIYDPTLGKMLDDSNPLVILINALWDEQSAETKQAWHRVTCQKSKDPNDLNLAAAFANEFAARTRS